MSRRAPRFASGRFGKRPWIIAIAVVALIAILIGWRASTLQAPEPKPVVAAVVPPEPAPAPARAPAPATPAPDAVAPPPEPAAPAPPELPPLPQVQVATHSIREVPPEKNPPPPDSTQLDMTRPPPGYASSSSGGYRPSVGPGASVPKQFQGPARVTAATSLTVGAIQVQLFGVKPPLPSDRCELAGTPTSCVELAKKRLLERFGRSDQVNCRTPNPQPGMVVAFAICLDANGIDLGSFLLNEGLALADTGQSYDYVGAEGVARTLKHGLWKFR
jgi:endonuclease YncB( thermonuclease family)